MGKKVIIRVIAILLIKIVVSNILIGQKEYCKAIHYDRGPLDTIYISERWHDQKGKNKEYVSIHKKNGNIINSSKSKPKNVEYDSILQFPICKSTLYFTGKNRRTKYSILEHFSYDFNSKGSVICKEDRKRATVKSEPVYSVQKWHSNGQLAYKERSTTKRKYHYRRYNEEGRLTVKWSRDFTKGVNRLDGWATIWHEKDKRKLYKLYFEQDRVVHFIQYDHRDRVAIKADYSEEDKSMYDLLPKRRAELLYIEKSCKSICFPQTPEVIDADVYGEK
ncbi:MAG: hypothetical protein GY810_02400 [Aureispira sp.]|nr:hypothetical protein [Aureispira sp.]